MTERENLISIITPVYNAAEYILDTIRSVLNQTISSWTLILVDDGSTDGTFEIVETFIKDNSLEEKIILIKQDEGKKGAAAARNTGIKLALSKEINSRYIAFIDADDLWLERRLEASLNHMQTHNAGFVFSAYEFGDEHAKGTGKIVHVPEKLTYRKALSRTIIFTTTTLFDTSIIPNDLLYMPEVPSEDTATWWRILRAGYDAYGIDEVLAIYRRPAKSLSSNKLVALKRIWFLYREVEKLSLLVSIFAFIGWAYRATIRRL